MRNFPKGCFLTQDKRYVNKIFIMLLAIEEIPVSDEDKHYFDKLTDKCAKFIDEQAKWVFFNKYTLSCIYQTFNVYRCLKHY